MACKLGLENGQAAFLSKALRVTGFKQQLSTHCCNATGVKSGRRLAPTWALMRRNSFSMAAIDLSRRPRETALR